MGIISYNKHRLISLLKYLNTKPGFSRLFYWIHEIRKNEFNTDKFMAFEMNEGYLLGCYNNKVNTTWKRFAEDTFEIEDTAIIKRMAPYFNYFIDIGAHIGYYSCLISRLRPESTIIAFEPSLENFKSLKKNIEINNIKNAIIYPIGLGIKKEKLILYGIDAMGSIIKGTYSQIPEKSSLVDIDKLDNYIDKVPQKASVFIKIDVEGNEHFVLQGASEFIKKIRPIGFIIEICRDWSGGKNPNFINTFLLMEKYDYDSYEIKEGAILEKIVNKDRLNGANYIFIRKDLSSKLEKI